MSLSSKQCIRVIIELYFIIIYFGWNKIMVRWVGGKGLVDGDLLDIFNASDFDVYPLALSSCSFFFFQLFFFKKFSLFFLSLVQAPIWRRHVMYWGLYTQNLLITFFCIKIETELPGFTLKNWIWWGVFSSMKLKFYFQNLVPKLDFDSHLSFH